MGARDTSGLFVLRVVHRRHPGRFIGRWSKKYGDRWLVMLGLSALAVGLILTASTPQIPVPWYNEAKSLPKCRAGLHADHHVTLPPKPTKLAGIIWYWWLPSGSAGRRRAASRINSLITKSAAR